MRYGSLEEPAEKLKWAAEQYRQIKNDMGGADHQSVSLRMQSSANGLQYDMYVVNVPPLPDHLPLKLGDIYHNLRGALDYLTYQLHERHYRGNIPAADIRDSQFPILGKPPTGSGGVTLGTDRWRGIKNLGAKERTAIAWLQPYNTRKDTLNGVRRHLSDINAINNIDKHRRLHVIQSMAQAVPTMASLSNYGLTQNPAFGVPIAPGVRIDTWQFQRTPPAPTMNRTWKGRAGAIFDLSGGRIDTMPHIAGSIASVVKVIERFAPLFDPLPTGVFQFPWVRVTEPLP